MPPFCAAKNSQLQAALATSCATKMPMATRRWGLSGARQIITAAMPINTYSTVQTGPNTAAGGAHAALSSWA